MASHTGFGWLQYSSSTVNQLNHLSNLSKDLEALGLPKHTVDRWKGWWQPLEPYYEVPEADCDVHESNGDFAEVIPESSAYPP
ncbi:hypothetical protein ACLB2K_033463 [Fragaria x ananassa]